MSSLYQKKNLKTFENQLTTWEIQKAWVALLKKQKNTWAGNQTLRNSEVMSSLFDKKHIKKNHEQQMTTWETQKAWVALLQNTHEQEIEKMRSSKVMSSLY